MRRATMLIAAAALSGCGEVPEPQKITHYEAPPPPPPTCTVANVLIQSADWRIEDPCRTTECPRMKGVATLYHNCPMPTGVEIKITGLSESQTPIATRNFWPASVQNIAPGQKYVFSLDMALDPDPRIKVITLEPIQVREW